jgi:hypothetical protein
MDAGGVDRFSKSVLSEAERSLVLAPAAALLVLVELVLLVVLLLLSSPPHALNADAIAMSAPRAMNRPRAFDKVMHCLTTVSPPCWTYMAMTCNW